MTKKSIVVALVIVGCVIRAGVSLAEPCDPLNCPGNSDLIALLGPYELDKTGVQWSRYGFRIVEISYADHNGIHPATHLDIIGASPQVNVGTATKNVDLLVGLRLILEHRPTGKRFGLIFQEYTRVGFYGGGGGFPGYKIKYTEIGDSSLPWPPLKDLCPYAQHVDHGVDSSWAVLWAGDRIEPFTGAIIASDVGTEKRVGPWFNISCAGEATIKMLRARTGGAIDLLSPVDQRQATLNMFAAAYCGARGPDYRYTKLGNSILWADLSGPYQSGPIANVESVWRGSGALCLLVQRDPTKPVNCPNGQNPPPCTLEMVASWSQNGWLVSGTP